MSGSTDPFTAERFYGAAMTVDRSTATATAAEEAFPVGSASARRVLAASCLIGGLLGAASGVAMAATPPMVGQERFSYPFDTTWHVVAELFFAVQHLALLAGLIGLALLPGARRSRSTMIGLVLAVVGIVGLIGCEVLAIMIADAAMSSPEASAVGGAYGLATTLTGVGLVMAGVGISRARLLPGAARWLVLITGGYVFVILFPALFGPMVAGRLVIAVWMLLFAAIGYALLRTAEESRSERDIVP
jgi:hypothetical protein